MKNYLILILICFICSGCRTDSNINDISGNNYISPLEVYFVTSPAAGEAWSPGTYRTIKWKSSSNPNPIDIYVIKKKTYYETLIVNNLLNTGSYTWYIPPDIPLSNHYQIRISESGKEGIAGYSEVFYIR